MEIKGTTVEWLVEYFSKYVDMNKHIEEIEQAKEMEKKQIIDFANDWFNDGNFTAEDYYTETFKK